MNVVLSLIEARVLACLVEKSITTPEYYPLTLGALTAACNQKSNRDPVMQIAEEEALAALDSLRDKKLAWQVSLAGSRVPKYRHNLTEVYPLNALQVAVLCELMLRGPQTAGELRSRAERMAPITEVAQVLAVLQELAAFEGGPLVVRLPRQAGKREERHAHLLCGVPPSLASGEAAVEDVPVVVSPGSERLSLLENRVVALEDELARLKSQFDGFMKQF